MIEGAQILSTTLQRTGLTLQRDTTRLKRLINGSRTLNIVFKTWFWEDKLLYLKFVFVLTSSSLTLFFLNFFFTSVSLWRSRQDMYALKWLLKSRLRIKLDFFESVGIVMTIIKTCKNPQRNPSLIFLILIF